MRCAPSSSYVELRVRGQPTCIASSRHGQPHSTRSANSRSAKDQWPRAVSATAYNPCQVATSKSDQLRRSIPVRRELGVGFFSVARLRRLRDCCWLVESSRCPNSSLQVGQLSTHSRARSSTRLHGFSHRQDYIPVLPVNQRHPPAPPRHVRSTAVRFQGKTWHSAPRWFSPCNMHLLSGAISTPTPRDCTATELPAADAPVNTLSAGARSVARARYDGSYAALVHTSRAKGDAAIATAHLGRLGCGLLGQQCVLLHHDRTGAESGP
jgi:hypothetical protein